MLIVFEGIDGAGKGAQIRRFLSFLRQHRVKYKLHKYPTSRAKEAFAHLAEEKVVPPLKLADVFAQDIMAQQKKLKCELDSGFVVVCDRYLHSTLAYQGVGARYAGLERKLLDKGAAVPDLVLLLDIDPALGARRKRRQKNPDRHEKNPRFLSAVRKNYLKMSGRCFLSYKYAVVDAAAGENEVFSRIMSHAEPLLLRKI